MKRVPLDVESLTVPVFQAWKTDWFLLTAGDFASGAFNPMTVAWGSLGVMWNKPFAQVVVRPSRHTFGFLERGSDFTLCAFPPSYRDALSLCGTKSGREMDKVQAAGLTPRASSVVCAPGYEEAEMILECRIIYRDEFDPKRFLDPEIESHYNGRDYHHIYFGEVLAAEGPASGSTRR
jgi:flavin reductase (DIM6/NTAB) family NADH-FMN oxidoreductase RutF